MFAYRALCKVAGVLAVLGALPGLAAALLGLFALMTRPDAPAWAYGLLVLLAAAAFGLIALGAQILRERVWAAALTALIYGYFTLLNLTKERLFGAAGSSLILALCLAIVIAAWRLQRLDRAMLNDEAG